MLCIGERKKNIQKIIAEQMKNIICPVSQEKVNEYVVRVTAFWIIMLTALYIAIPNLLIPVFLVTDFYIRAFTRYRYSPVSWLSAGITRRAGFGQVWIDKAPKVFAARIGLVLSLMILVFTLTGFPALATVVASILVFFAFLECGINFCAGCWVYTYVVLPLYRNK